MQCDREKLVYKTVQLFFNDRQNIDIVLPIVSGTDKISLRLIDWFITNYSKVHATQYMVKNSNTPFKQFIVYLDYKAQLKSFSKKLFDPFCRRNRIIFNYDKKDTTKSFCTTVGQLNFFKWAIQNKIIEYMRQNITNIENHMNSQQKITNTEPKKVIKKHEVKIILTFQ